MAEMMYKTADEKEGPHWTVEEVLETIDEDIQSLEEEMTEAQFEQADKVWGEFLADMVAKLEIQKTDKSKSKTKGGRNV